MDNREVSEAMCNAFERLSFAFKNNPEWNIAALNSLCESFKSRGGRSCGAKESIKNFFLETVNDSFKYELLKFIVHKDLTVDCLVKWEDAIISSDQIIIRNWAKVEHDFIENHGEDEQQMEAYNQMKASIQNNEKDKEIPPQYYMSYHK